MNNIRLQKAKKNERKLELSSHIKCNDLWEKSYEMNEKTDTQKVELNENNKNIFFGSLKKASMK